MGVKPPAIGIDLGTTHSLIATVEAAADASGSPRRAKILPTHEGHDLLPSVVSYRPGQEAWVGFEAKQQDVSFSSVKRYMGKSAEDLPEAWRHRPELPIEVSATILKTLKRSAERALDQGVSQVVITVPAYFDDRQRQATRAAARLAGLMPLRILNEPTAAALAYGVDARRNGCFAVFDLGGGTFDVSILKIQDGLFEVLSTGGDTALGGDDLDRALVEHFHLPLTQENLRAAEAARKALSDPACTTAQVGSFALSRAEHDRVLTPVLHRTIAICARALSDAGLSATAIDEVLMVGGTTRMPLVREMASEAFGRSVNASLDPDRVVALGAALQADILAGNRPDMLLMDVVPLTLGIEMYGGLFQPLIHRNSKIPTIATEVFTTYADRQTGVDIHVLQGERERVSDNRSLGRFKLTGIQPQAAGQARIEVTFLIDADGILQVTAKDLNTQKLQSIEVRPSSGLTDQKVEQMLLDGLENAEKDVAARQSLEQLQKLDSLVHHVEKHLGAARTFWESKKLDDRSWEELQAAFQEASSLTRRHHADTALELDAEVFVPARERLTKASHRLAELLVYQSLKG